MRISEAELYSAALDPGWADEHPDEAYLVVELGGGPELDRQDHAQLDQWLHALPIPVVAVGAETATLASTLAASMDLVVSSEEDLESVRAGIRRNPEASAVLVQVLRNTTSLDPVQALTLESLGYATLQAGPEFADWLTDRRSRKQSRVVAATDDILLMERNGEELRLVLNSPETRNSLSAAMRDALTAAFRLVAMDASVGSVTVAGHGPSFCSGGDLEEFGLLSNPAEAHRTRLLRMPARFLVPEAGRYRFKVHGACIGAGIELPAFAAHVSAAPGSFFQLPEISMGLIPGAGGCVSIPRRIGRQRTAFMAITGQSIDAERALEWGLIDAIDR